VDPRLFVASLAAADLRRASEKRQHHAIPISQNPQLKLGK
jgi:hypothetical protein